MERIVPRFLAVAAAAIMVAGCYEPAGPEVFSQAETLYLDGRYDEAIEAFKRYLMDHPDDAGAHHYLGVCYLHSQENRWLVLAEGELKTALALFERSGKVNPIERYGTAKYFEIISHIDLGKVRMRQLELMLSRETPVGVDMASAARWAFEGLVESYRAAEAIDPEHKDVQAMRPILEYYRQAIPRRLGGRN